MATPTPLTLQGQTYIPAAPTGSLQPRTPWEKFINADPLVFQQNITTWVDGLRVIPDPIYGNQLVKLQANLRSSGMSKDKTNLYGNLSTEDITGLDKTMREANLNGLTDINAYLLKRSEQATNLSNVPTFSKTVSTAIRLIDKAKGQQMLSDAFLKTYGYSPSQTEIQNFTDKFNAAATKSASTTTTSTTSGKGFSRSTSTTTGGFESDAQQQLIADTLKKSLKLDDNLHGQAGEFVKQLQQGASDNLLPAIDNNVLANTVARIIGQTDPTIQKQMIADELQKFRNQASQLHPGAAVSLKAGLNYSDIVSPYKSITAKRGLEVNNDDPLLANMINVKDKNGTFRNATAAEADSIIMSDPRWLKTGNAISTFSSLAQDIRRGAGL
jgi:hypothetical protein